MSREKVSKLMKRLSVGMLAVAMIGAGVMAYPRQTKAAVAEDKVIYEKYQSADIATNYWNAEKKVAPVKEGYVFGGWFEQVTEQTGKTETYTENGENTYYNPLTTVSGDAYAKFVPAQVLSVKAQNQGTVNKEYIESFKDGEDFFYVRIVSSLDSTNYQRVGFDIYLGNRIKVYKAGTTNEPTETNKVYSGLKVGTETKTANEVFGAAANYLSVWQLSKIDHKSNVGLIIYVRPYWVTTDGTRVNGLAKYLHIEDEYLGYINVPVNLLGGEKVAAGIVNVTYSGATAGSLNLIAFEKGRIFSEMDYNCSGNSVKIIGNTGLGVNQYQEDGETLYANLRFAKPSVDTEFNIVDDDNQFCDWAEHYVDVKKVWDTKYTK